MGSCGSLVARQYSRTSTPAEAQPGRLSLPRNSLMRQPMSMWSSPAVPNSSWSSENFLLGAGMVVFQPATLKVVVIWERQKKYWFLPKGRKDVGESLEETALREAYEESGYRVEPFPLYTNTCAPGPPTNLAAPDQHNCEPIYINTTSYSERRRRNYTTPPGEYLTFWYVGQIPEDAVREEGTGMPDEVNYETHLLDVRDALPKLGRDEALVVEYASELYHRTLQIELFNEEQRNNVSHSNSSRPGHPASV